MNRLRTNETNRRQIRTRAIGDNHDVPADEVRKAVRLFASEKPSCYCTWVGLEQDRDALKPTARSVCFYSLTGQYDQRGSNVLFDTPKMNPITGRELLPKSNDRHSPWRRKTSTRTGNPIRDSSKPRHVYDAILTEQPYPVKALVLFGTDPLLGHGDPLRGKAALEKLDFYLHVDTTINPSAMFADLFLPASTCWEREGFMPFFEIADDTMNWVATPSRRRCAVGRIPA